MSARKHPEEHYRAAWDATGSVPTWADMSEEDRAGFREAIDNPLPEAEARRLFVASVTAHMHPEFEDDEP